MTTTTPLPDILSWSRQRQRKLTFDFAFAEVTKQFGGELRRYRRRIARKQAKALWQAARAQKENN